MPAIRSAGESSRSGDGRDQLSTLLGMCRCVTLAFLEAEAYAGDAADSRRKRSGECVASESPIRRKFTGQRQAASRESERQGCRAVLRGLLGMDGQPLYTGYPGYKPLPGRRWANTTAAGLCPDRWFCAAVLASRRRTTCARLIATSFSRRLVGNLAEYAWQFNGVSLT